MLRRVLIASVVLGAAAASATSFAGAPLVVSVWGGNWKDTIERVVAKPYTAQTGIPVEFEVGGTLDRLANARVAKGAPLVDVTVTTSRDARRQDVRQTGGARAEVTRAITAPRAREEEATVTPVEPWEATYCPRIDVATVMARSERKRTACASLTLLLAMKVPEAIEVG